MTTVKVALITGAAGGLGRAVALRFYNEGYHLVLSDIDANGLEALKQQLTTGSQHTDQIKICPGDLAVVEYLRNLVNTCRQQWGRLDVLVNNAVWRTHDTMRNITEANWEKTLKIGLTAPAFLAKWGAELMEEKRIPGTVINVSSIQAERTGGTSPAYIACKGAMNRLTYEWAALYGSTGIRVVGVAPGNVITPLSGDFVDSSGQNISRELTEYMEDQTALKRSADPVEIANVIYWLTTDEASFVNGTIVTVDGGFSHGFGSNALKNKHYPGQF